MTRPHALLLALCLVGSAEAALREEVALTLRDGSSAPDVFLAVEVTPENPYVQQQVMLRRELWQAIDLREPAFADPVLEHAMLEQFNDSERTVKRDGRTYRVTTRHIALMPQRSGPWTIPPMVLRAGLPVDGRIEPWQAATPELQLEVRPAPVGAPLDHWLPSPWLHVDWDWPETMPLEVGRGIDVTYKIRAGNLTAMQLPELRWAPQEGLISVPRRVVVATETVDLELAGNREWTVSLVPTRAGRYVLPAFEFPWWNTLEDRPEVAYIPSLTLNVYARGQIGSAPARQSRLQRGAAGVGIVLFAVIIWRRRWLMSMAQQGRRTVRLWRACRRHDAAAAAAALHAMGGCKDSGELQRATVELESCRFGRVRVRWNGAALWRAWRSSRRGRSRSDHRAVPLPDLYPQPSRGGARNDR